MSPFSRRVGRSFSRRPSRPRTFRTQWVGFGIGSGLLTPDTSIHQPIIGSSTLAQNFGLNQPTLIRIRGELVAIISDGVIEEGSTEQALVYCGLHVVDSDDTQPGGNPDDPFTNSSSNQWLFYRSVYLASFPSVGPTMGSGDTRNPLLAVARFDVDVKSRRRIENGQALAVAYTFPTPGSLPATSVGMIIHGRALFHEFGR